MNIKNPYGLIHLGLLIRLFVNIRATDDVEFIRSHFEKLESELNKFEFNVSLSAFNGLIKSAIIDKYITTFKDDDEIGSEIANKIIFEMKTFEKIIFSEATTKKIYIVPQRRYNNSYLLESPEKLLKNGIFGKLSDIAKFDFTASCRCLAFGESTACAFHILRATEDTLKSFYFKYKKTNRLAKPMWGPMTSELRLKKTNKPPENILSALDVVRNSYRNPTQHPLAKYDIDSAQDLFGVCVDLINKMAEPL